MVDRVVQVPEDLVRQTQALLVAFVAGVGSRMAQAARAEQIHDALRTILEACVCRAPVPEPDGRCDACGGLVEPIQEVWV